MIMIIRYSSLRRSFTGLSFAIFRLIAIVPVRPEFLCCIFIGPDDMDAWMKEIDYLKCWQCAMYFTLVTPKQLSAGKPVVIYTMAIGIVTRKKRRREDAVVFRVRLKVFFCVEAPSALPTHRFRVLSLRFKRILTKYDSLVCLWKNSASRIITMIPGTLQGLWILNR
jgi:hypothetical protein